MTYYTKDSLEYSLLGEHISIFSSIFRSAKYSNNIGAYSILTGHKPSNLIMQTIDINTHQCAKS